MKARPGTIRATIQEQPKTDARLQGRALFIARTIWIAIVLFDLITLIISIPLLVVQTSMTCLDPTKATCGFYQLSSAQIGTLHSFGLSLGAYITYALVCDLLITLLLLVFGALIFWHKSADRVGLFVSLLFITFGSFGISDVHVTAMNILSPPAGIGAFVYNATNIIGNIINAFLWPALGIFFYIFPDGRFVPRWSWMLTGLFIIQFIFYMLPAPLNILYWPPALSTLEFIIVYGSTIGTQIYRYLFVASPIQRQQIKGLVVGFVSSVLLSTGINLSALFPALNGPHSLTQFSEPLTLMLAFLPIPLSVGIALLRYRLWDIDVLINRTLVYGLLTATLLVVYLALVFVGQALLSSLLEPNNGVALVGSTLIVAALFQPLRQRIQQLIDRRFYRRKYDAQKTLAAFSTVLRQEVDLDQLREQLLAVVEETMQPTHLSLWIRPVKQQASGGGIRGESPSPVEERPDAD